MKATADNLARLATYGKGWDGYYAEPAKRAAISDARRFLETAQDAFDLDLEPDGTVNLVRGQGAEREVIAFEGDGTATIMTRDGDQWFIGATFTV